MTLVHNATVEVSCQLHKFSLKTVNVKYDTQEKSTADEVMCLPILKFTNPKVHPETELPQLHGILRVR